MMKLDAYLNLIRRAKSGGFVLAGGEAFLRDEAEAALLSAAGDAGLVRLDGAREGGLEAADVLDEARSVPLMGGARVIAVRRADALVKKSPDAFAACLSDPEPETFVVLHVEEWDKRSAAARKLDKWTVDCGSLYETEFGSSEATAGSPLGRWIARRAAGRGLGLTGDAVVALMESVGTNLAELEGALERIAAVAGGGAVGPEELMEMLAPSRTHSVFRVAELAVSGRTAEAYAAADACFERGLPDEKGKVTTAEGAVAARLVWAIGREIETLFAARGLLDEGQDLRSNAPKIGIPPFRADAVGKAARRADPARLEKGLELAFEAEWAQKRGEADGRMAVERLIVELGRS